MVFPSADVITKASTIKYDPEFLSAVPTIDEHVFRKL